MKSKSFGPHQYGEENVRRNNCRVATNDRNFSRIYIRLSTLFKSDNRSQAAGIRIFRYTIKRSESKVPPDPDDIY